MPHAGSDRRRATRRRVRLRVRFWNDEIEGTGFTSTVSRADLFVETPKTLEPGTRLHLEIGMKSGPFFAEGVVARVLRASRTVQPVVKPGVGLRLVGLLEELRDAAGGGAEEQLVMDLTDPAALAAVYVRDIERGGLFVPTSRSPERDTTVSVRLDLPAPHAPVEVKGVVIQEMGAPSPGVGLQLVDVDELRAKLAELITA